MSNRVSLLVRMLTGLGLTATSGLTQSVYTPYTFNTVAGNAGFGSSDGVGSTARFFYPRGIAVDDVGNTFVADAGNHTIRKVTSTGAVTTLAGLARDTDGDGSPDGAYADGVGSAARFHSPYGVAVDGSGNIYVADSRNHAIRKITSAGDVTTLAGLAGNPGSADGIGSVARFNYPFGVAADSDGNIYVADGNNHTIRKVTSTGTVTTLAGSAGDRGGADGTGPDARFSDPLGVSVDVVGNVYVGDSANNTIRKVTPSGDVTTVAGLAGKRGSADGPGSDARFYDPIGVAVDGAGNVYVADHVNHTIRKVSSSGEVTTLAGLPGSQGDSDGTVTNAHFFYPSGVAVDTAGNLYVGDTFNNTIRKLTPAARVTTLAGLAGSIGSADGTGSTARFNRPQSLTVDSAGIAYVADGFNHTIRKVTPSGAVTTLAGFAGIPGGTNGTGNDARFFNPKGVAVDSAGIVFVADTSNHTIRKVTPAGVVTALAGLITDADGNGFPDGGYADGTGGAARFNLPQGVALDPAGNIFVADTENHAIRKVTSAGVVTTLAGVAGNPGSGDGPGTSAQFHGPQSVAADGAGNVYVADTGNNTIRKVTTAGAVTTLAGLAGTVGSTDGTGSAARFNYPYGVAVDTAGNIYVADSVNQTIRRVTPSGIVTTVAGLAGNRGSADGTGSVARFRYPWGVAVDSTGTVWVADTSSNTIRKGYPAPMIMSSDPGFGFNGGEFGFRLAGPAGQTVIVEASSNLVSWLPVWTNTFSEGLSFKDPEITAYSIRLYRTVTP